MSQTLIMKFEIGVTGSKQSIYVLARYCNHIKKLKKIVNCYINL